MKETHLAMLGIISLALSISIFAFVQFTKHTYEAGGLYFEQVGVVEQSIDGKTLYIPVYQKR